MFEEVEDPSNRSFFSEIIASVSDVKFSHNGRYLLTRDYLTAKVGYIVLNSRARYLVLISCHLLGRCKFFFIIQMKCFPGLGY